MDVGHNDKTIAGRRDYLLAEQSTATTLDQMERAAYNLVGAVYRKIDPLVLGEGGQRNAGGGGLSPRPH